MSFNFLIILLKLLKEKFNVLSKITQLESQKVDTEPWESGLKFTPLYFAMSLPVWELFKWAHIIYDKRLEE